MIKIKRRKLDAMVIGADRSGSTWLRMLCIQNPEIYVCPVWQRAFLSKQTVARHKFYRPMRFNCPLNDYQGEKVVLGVRNMAIYHGDKVAKLYFSHNKNMKFLLSVRNPIERTFSQFMVRAYFRMKAGGHATYDINRELSMEEPHVKRTMIYTLLEPYLALFPAERFFIYPLELMMENTALWVNKVYDFLGVEQNIPIEREHKLANPGKYNRDDFAPMTDDSKRHLIALCIGEMEKLSELSGIDLVDLWGLKKYL